MIKICPHLFETNFYSLSRSAKILWIYAAARADEKGIVQIHINVLPRLVGLSETEGVEALEELTSRNFYNDDQPPFLSKYEEENWCVSKILPWRCNHCQRIAREFISPSIREEVLSVGFCAHCQSTENLEVDHICPVSLGGSSERENLQALCGRCNRSKRNRFIG